MATFARDCKKSDAIDKKFDENVSLKRIINDHAKSLLIVPNELVEKIKELHLLKKTR